MVEGLAGLASAVIGAAAVVAVSWKSPTVRRLEELERLQEVLQDLSPSADRKKIADYHDHRVRGLASFIRPEAIWARAVSWFVPFLVLVVSIALSQLLIGIAGLTQSINVQLAFALLTTFVAVVAAAGMQGWQVWHDVKLAKLNKQDRLDSVLDPK